jgi:tetratricopeptide (TPR) repeat protein
VPKHDRRTKLAPGPKQRPTADWQRTVPRRPSTLARPPLAAIGGRRSRLLLTTLFLGAALLGVLAWRARRIASPLPVPPAQVATATDEHETALRAAVSRAPNDGTAHQSLGAYLAEHGRPAEALWELAVARELDRAGATPQPSPPLERGTPSAGATDNGSRAAGEGSAALERHAAAAPPDPSRGADATASVQIAGALQLAGLPGPALDLLRQARREHPGDASVTLALADALLGMAQAQEAVSLLIAAPTVADTPEGLLALGRARFAAGDMKGARAALLLCRERGARVADADQLLGQMALAAGSLNEARARLGAAASTRSTVADAQYEAGMAWLGEPREALRYFAAALRLDPRHARAGYEYSRLLREQRGQWGAAVRAYGQALALDPDLAEAELGLARVLAPLGMPAEVAYHRARYFRLKGRPELAVPLYRRWGELRPERWESVLRVAECQTEMQCHLDAVRVLEAGLKRFPTSVPLLRQLAQLDLLTYDPAEAARTADRWARLDSTSGEPEWFRGRIALKAHQPDEALRWAEAALRKNPNQPIFQLAVAQALAGSPTVDRLRRAESLLAAAEAADPRGREYAYQHGVVLQALNDPEGARRAFLRALELDPRRVEAYNSLVQSARRLGRPGAASFFADLERTARRQAQSEQSAFRTLWARPDDPAARWAVARALLDRGDLTRAADHLEVAATPAGPAEARAALKRVRALLALQGP